MKEELNELAIAAPPSAEVTAGHAAQASPPHRLIAPPAACRIMSAPEEVMRLSWFTSAAGSHTPLAARWDAKHRRRKRDEHV